jgi:phosphopantothenoylcysteine synthetase/decarboxylase
VDPVESNLACGTKGIGAMAPLKEIVRAVNDSLQEVMMNSLS